MKKKAIIIGAGISGPAMALQLKRIGIESEIFEARKPDEMTKGVFLGITPNGLNALKRFVQIYELKKHYTPGKMSFYNYKNHKIAELDTKEQLKLFGAETIQIKRTQLSKLLRQKTAQEGISIKYGMKVSEAGNLQEGAYAVFNDGTVAEADLIIGCDGINSVIRKKMFPGISHQKYTGMLSTGAFTKIEGMENQFGDIKMIFGREAFFAYAVSNQGDVWWFNNYYRENEPTKEEINGVIQKELKNNLLNIHKNDSPEINRIIESTEDIFVYPIYETKKLDKWYDQNIILIGDAAHTIAPHIGQGASLALEDTAVLAKIIEENGVNEQAFRKFQEMRSRRVDKIVKTSRRVAKKKRKPNAIISLLRDTFLKYFIKLESKKLYQVYNFNCGD